MKTKWWKTLLFARFLSPRGFLLRAIAILVIFLVLHSFGLRESATVLSGTSPTGARPDPSSVAFALAYILAYFGVVLLVPVLVLAAGIFLAIQYAPFRTFVLSRFRGSSMP
jgi:hypothetical protein